MKKIFAILLSALMVFALVACADDNTELPEENGEQIENVETPETPDESETPADSTFSPANTLLQAFKDMKANGEYTDVESAANALIANPIIPFMGGAMAVEPGFLQGFDADITGFKSGAVFMPMIGAIPFVGYVFELEEGADVNAFVQTLNDNANMRWLICTAAEEVVCEAVDNTVFFCMAKASFEEEAPAEDEFFEELPVEDIPAVMPVAPSVDDIPAAMPEEAPSVEDIPEDAIVELPIVNETPEDELVPELPEEEFVVETPVESEEEPAEAPAESDLTPANTLLKAFKDMKANGEYTDAESAANALITNPIIPFMGGAMAIEPGFLQGFNVDITGFKSGAVFMPMIGAIPFVGYVFELEEGADVDAFVQTLNDNANMRWLICTAAEEIVCEAVDNTVFFCMAKASFAE